MNERDEILRLTETLERYRQMIKHAGSAIFAIDPEDGVITEANVMAEELTGFSESELTGMAVWDLHPDGEKTAAKELFQRVLATGTGE